MCFGNGQSPLRSAGRLAAAWMVLAGIGTVLHAQTPTFQGVGQLPSGTGSMCLGVSADGTMVVGEAVNSAGKTVAFSYDRTAGPPMDSLGFLDATYQKTSARDVGSDSLGTVHIAGDGLNASNKTQAFHWSGTRAGVGSFFVIPYLPNSSSNPQAFGRSLVIDPFDTVFIAGESTSSSATDSTPNEAFRYRSDLHSVLGLGYLNGGSKRSGGYGIQWSALTTTIVGWSNSKWGGGNNQAEGFVYNSNAGGSIVGDKGLDWVCGGEQWQYAAGPNGTSDTTANADNIQVQSVGTSGLDPNDIVISCGPDNQLKDQLNPSGDDIEWPNPLASNPGATSLSRYNAISPDGRYRAGRSTYPGANGLFEAGLRDTKNHDYTVNDNCGGIAFHWPLGFLSGDNYSEALGVSNGSGTQSREGLTVVGWSRQANVPGPGYANESRAFLCLIQEGLDLWFLKHQGAAPGDNGASAASQYKGMLDLKAWLVSKSIDMTGWELREARAVSDDGSVIVGWGVHDGVNEGFIVTIEPPPPTGACCVKTGFGTGGCSIEEQAHCEAPVEEGGLGGIYRGNDSVCGVNNANCNFCGEMWADTDEDGDIDIRDFAVFQICFTGPGGGVPAGCSCFDRYVSGPSGIDTDDFIAFQNCVTGATILFDSLNPPPGCVP